MAKADRGTKRQCQSCATKFYDLNRDPVLCPNCGTQFQLAVVEAPVEKEEVAAVVVEDKKSDEIEVDAAPVVAGAEVISLEDADDDDEDEDDVIENLPDVDLDDDDEPVVAADDNTFLETDDDDDEIGIEIPAKKDEE